jgi:hypothetical protein
MYASYLKDHAKSPSNINDDAFSTNSTFEASILKENVELRAQREFLSSNYGKLEEIHGKISRSHEDILVSHDRLKLDREVGMSKVTSCEPHVNTNTTSQNDIIPCASRSNSSTHTIAISCVSYPLYIVSLTMKFLLPLVLVSLLTMQRKSNSSRPKLLP